MWHGKEPEPRLDVVGDSWSVRCIRRATNAHLQQLIVNTSRHTTWQRFPPIIGAKKQRSEGNHNIECRRNGGLLCNATCGIKLAISAFIITLETSIGALIVAKEGDIAPSPSPFVKNNRLANTSSFYIGKVLLFASFVHVVSCNERF